jgi:hypothetical protein
MAIKTMGKTFCSKFCRAITSYFKEPFLAFKKLWATKKMRFIPWVEVLFVLAYPFSEYTYGFGNLGLFILFALSLYLLIRRREVSIYKPLVFVVFYALLICLLKLISSENRSYIINTFFSISLMFVCTCFLATDLDLNKLSWVWFCLGWIAAIGLFYHAILIYGLKRTVRPIPIFFPSTGENAWRFSAYSSRPESFFLEPAEYVGFILIPLVLSLWKRRYLSSFVFCSSAILSSSTIGLIVSVLIISVYFFIVTFAAGHKKRGFLLAGVFVLFLVFFFTLPIFAASRSKLINELSGKGSIISRLFSPFFLCPNLSSFELLFGINFSSLRLFEDSNAFLVPIQGYQTYGYTNSLGQAVILYGLIFALIYLFYFVFTLTHLKKTFLLMVFIGVSDLLTASTLFNLSFWMYWIVVLSMISQQEDNPHLFFFLHFSKKGSDLTSKKNRKVGYTSINI